jgi:monothiol glutaredoxin
VRCLAALSPEMRATLDKVVGSSKVVLFMKGTKDLPQCGFSHTVVQILRSLDVLSNEALRQGLKEYSSWPTFPQLYIDGEFFGGCDITAICFVDSFIHRCSSLEIQYVFTELTISWYWKLTHWFNNLSVCHPNPLIRHFWSLSLIRRMISQMIGTSSVHG